MERWQTIQKISLSKCDYYIHGNMHVSVFGNIDNKFIGQYQLHQASEDFDQPEYNTRYNGSMCIMLWIES